MDWLNVFFWGGESFIAVMLIRNYLVGKERKRVIDEIGRLGQLDIDEHRFPWWRWQLFMQVSHEKMLFSVRPVRAFFKDSPALQPGPSPDPDQNVWDFLDGKPEPSIECPQCGMRSYHPMDVLHKYCGNCHLFHDQMTMT